jgi:ribosomal protein L37E
MPKKKNWPSDDTTMPLAATPATECQPVAPGSECPACHWPNDPDPKSKGFRGETHVTFAHGSPNLKVTNVCANCGAFWNLDTVECSTCGWKPMDPKMQDNLIEAKNAILKRQQQSKMLPPREMPIEVVKESDIAREQREAAERATTEEEARRKAEEEAAAGQ